MGESEYSSNAAVAFLGIVCGLAKEGGKKQAPFGGGAGVVGVGEVEAFLLFWVGSITVVRSGRAHRSAHLLIYIFYFIFSSSLYGTGLGYYSGVGSGYGDSLRLLRSTSTCVYGRDLCDRGEFGAQNCLGWSVPEMELRKGAVMA